MATNRRYTKRDRMVTVIAAELTSNVATSEATGIPESTIRLWRNDPKLAKYCEKTREELIDGVTMMAHLSLEQIVGKIDTFEPRDLVTLFGVMVDKAQLLSGGATSRAELRDVSGTLTDLDILEALRTAEDLTRTGAPRASEEAEGTPEG